MLGLSSCRSGGSFLDLRAGIVYVYHSEICAVESLITLINIRVQAHKMQANLLAANKSYNGQRKKNEEKV